MQEYIPLKNDRGCTTMICIDIPENPASGRPFVIAVHGLDSDHHEYGLYDTVANKLAENGITCLRFDFPGNGKSCELFTRYTHANMLSDMESVYRLATDEFGLSKTDFGIQGYSMGGRMSCLFTEKHPEARCLSLWAPGISQGIDMIKSFLKNEPDPISAYKEIEREGVFHYNPFGVHELTFSAAFFNELRHNHPFEALNCYHGAVFCAMGEHDIIVNPRDMELVQIFCDNAVSLEMLKFADGGHDFGTAYGRGVQDHEIQSTLVSKTVDFFVRQLLCG